MFRAPLFTLTIPLHVISKYMIVYLYSNHEVCALSKKIRLPGLQSLKWRVDVTISTR